MIMQTIFFIKSNNHNKMFSNCAGSAPGKLIFAGEHAVVYGATAVAVSVAKRTVTAVQQREDAIVRIEYAELETDREFNLADLKHIIASSTINAKHPTAASDELLRAIKAVCGVTADEKDAFVPAIFLIVSIVELGEKGFNIRVHSDLPTGAGLGSSAAFAVSMTTALLGACGHIGSGTDVPLSESEKELVNNWAYYAECILHGNPSGIDNTTSTFGGAVSLQNRIPKILSNCRQLRLLIVNTRVPRSTMQLVRGVKERRERYPEVLDAIIASLGSISAKCIDMIAPEKSSSSSSNNNKEISKEEFEQLSELISIAHPQLNALGVGHESLDSVVRITRKYNFSSKLTGAGGGGCAFALLPQDCDDISAVTAELEQLGYSCFEAQVGCVGAQLQYPK